MRSFGIVTIPPLKRMSSDGQAVEAHGGLPDADRHALAIFAARPDAPGSSFHVVADHGNPGQCVRPVANKGSPLTGAPLRPFSIKYASVQVKTNLPFVISTCPPPKFTA